MESVAKKLPKAIGHLDSALKKYKTDPNDLNFLTVAKTFEILIEYAWRECKRFVEDQGLEAPAPKMAIKEAAKLNLITDPAIWLECIDARNNSVHDYFGVSEKEYVSYAHQLLELIRDSKLFKVSIVE